MKILKKLYLPLLALVAIIISIACGCVENKLPITKDELIGKSKEEVLEIAFKKSPLARKNIDKSITIGYKTKNWGNAEARYKNIEDALSSANLIDCDLWTICHKRAPFRIDALVNYWVLKFEDNKVISVEKGGYSEF